MKLRNLRILAIAATMTLGLTTIANAEPKVDGSINKDPGFIQKEDNRPDPLTTKQLELKEQALNAKLNGKAKGKTHEVAKGQYVELERTGEGAIWTVLGEFQDLKHNTIPKPDRNADNSTIWTSDFSKDYYMNMLFNDTSGANSMSNFYKEQSSNSYTVNGDVTDWILVPGNAANYDDNASNDIWKFLQDEVNGWYKQQKDAGKTDAELNAYLSQFDKRDRYDYDGDGNFNEPDGYIDTFQSVHAGEGEEAGAPPWTIWSHSWYAYQNLAGIAGPSFNKLGGIQIGNSNYWVGKYTVQPENGGVGVFTHEYGHDLGLPDLYDTSGGENSTAFWTLMSSGSWLSDGTQDIGSLPSHMGAWEKYQMGWLNYEVADPSKNNSAFRLGPVEFNTKQAQAVIVPLPKKSVSLKISSPYAGSNFYYSGQGDNLDNFMYKSLNLPSGAALNAKVKYDIEKDWDYAYLVYSTDNGTTWKSLETNRSSNIDPNGQNKGFGITGSSSNQWVDLTANLPSGNILLGFRYWTDANTGGNGLMVDDIKITSLATDGAESEAGWTFKGFKVSTGTENKLYDNYYIAEYRTYKGYDSSLQTGPYFFGYTSEKANYVDHFPYQDGLLINYWDTSQKNNNTKQHPGAGLILPIDSHYKAVTNVNGAVWRNRVQSYDATFSLYPTDKLNLHVGNILSPILSQPAVKVFDDSIQYWDSANPQGSVKNPNTGTIIQVRQQNDGNQPPFMEIQVRFAK
ncbi:immune inhibitor A domain-containing protein [Candidatus Clostridium stratigraminis]|uniref:Immune inhibitor A domain-containing protein n=1 Tax=Candidatus Clostridium stratigraminis TaxID=3381661 RepID=A0ABW8T2T9_9CLOT